MLITKEQQEALIENYNKEGHTIDERWGFMMGVNKTMELLTRLDIKQKQDERDYRNI